MKLIHDRKFKFMSIRLFNFSFTIDYAAIHKDIHPWWMVVYDSWSLPDGAFSRTLSFKYIGFCLHTNLPKMMEI